MCFASDMVSKLLRWEEIYGKGELIIWVNIINIYMYINITNIYIYIHLIPIYICIY